MARVRRGSERKLYHGTAGSTATNQLLHATDIDVDKGIEFDETTARGDGTSIVKVHEQPVALTRSIKFKIKYRDGNTPIDAILAVVSTAAAIAIKVVLYDGGPTEFDGDMVLTLTSPGPLKAGMEMEFEGHPTDTSGREWA